MNTRFVRILLFFALAIYFPLTSMAWGLLGHRIVGEIADSYLTPKAKEEIRKVLGNESVAMASNWADFIKSDTSYRYLSNWHWIDFPKGLSYVQMNEQLTKDTAADAYTRLIFLVREL